MMPHIGSLTVVLLCCVIVTSSVIDVPKDFNDQFFAGTSSPQVEVKATLGGYAVFDCPVEFPQGFKIQYNVIWSIKEGENIYLRQGSFVKFYDNGYEGRISNVSEGSDYGYASINLTDIRESDRGLYECKVVFPNRTPASRSSGIFFNLEIEEEQESTTNTDPSSSETNLEIDSIGPPENLTIQLNTNGYLLSWTPPTENLERLRVYIVRMFQSPAKHLISSTETKNTYFLIDELDEEEIYHFQVSSMTMNDLDVPGEMITVHIPAYGKIRLVVAGVGCVLLVILLGAVLWYAKVKSDEVAQQSKNTKQEA